MRRAASLLATGVLALGAGGQSASSNPSTLLRQTFESHAVRSGVLSLSLVITPKGSSQLTTPLSLSLSGPFEAGRGGHPSQSALTVAFSGLGRRGSLGVTTTATGAYVTLQGTSYKLPSADFKKLQSSLGASGRSSGTPGLSSLGIDPSRWVTGPRIVGTATVDGVVTEHLHAAVDVRAFVLSLNKLLAKESSTLSSAAGAASRLPTRITAAEATKIAAEIRRPTVDVYTGKSDSTLRRLVIAATLPVHGTLSAELGGLSSASFRLSVDYSHLNQPQTVTAPAHAKSFAALESRLQTLGQSLSGGITGGAGAGSSSQVSKYARCIQRANGSVAKMQRCASLLKSGG